MLLDAWGKDKDFLLAEFAQWIRKEHHKTLKTLWPPTGRDNQEGGKKTDAKKAVVEGAMIKEDEFASGTGSDTDDE